jgi:cobalamin biosynthesis protein CobT
MNYLDVVNFETYVAGCARDSGVKVVWDNPDSTPRTDGRTMWLPSITSTTPAEWLTRMRYYVKHETSHISYSDFKILEKYRPKGLLALINNLIEDHRIDFINDSQYAGDAITSNNFWVLYADDIVKRIKSTDKDLSEQQRTVLPLFVWDAAIRTWITNAAETRDVMASMLDDDGIDKLHKLEKYTDELLVLRCDTGLDVAERVFDLATRILIDLFDAEPEDYTDVGKPESEGGKGKAKGDGDDSKGEGKGDDVDRIVDVEKLMKAIGHEHKPTRTGVHLMLDKADLDGSYTIPHKDQYVIVKFPELHREVRGHGVGHFKSDDVSKYITSNAKPLANQLRMRLQTRSRDRYEYGLKRGKLHTGSLHKLLSGNTEASTRVFRKRIVSDTLDTAVTLLVDCSGSMSGKKYEMACAGAGAMAEALKPLNIAFNVLGFTNTSGADDPIIWVFNDFGERVSTPDLVKRFAIASGCLWENTDGDALAYASYVLGMRREQRKVLLVLSDGSPAGRDSHGDIQAYTARVVKDIEASGVDIYGIGIRDDNVRLFYKKHEVVNDIANLSGTILSILDRSI